LLFSATILAAEIAPHMIEVLPFRPWCKPLPC
jgi:hypothetical protein